MGLLKRGQRIAALYHRHQARQAIQIDLEALGVEDLRDQATVRQRGRIAPAKLRSWQTIGFALCIQQVQLALKGLQAGACPVRVPAGLGLLRDSHLLHQMLEHAQIVERVNLAGDHLRQRPHMGTAQGIRWQQGMLGMGLIQLFDDGHGLSQPVAIVRLKRWHQSITHMGRLGSGLMLAAHQMHGNGLERQALEQQCNTNAI